MKNPNKDKQNGDQHDRDFNNVFAENLKSEVKKEKNMIITASNTLLKVFKNLNSEIE